MATHKPLPDIPAAAPVVTVANLTTLSVEARAHRGRFIRHILSEGELADEDELWAGVLEDALDELGDSVSRGLWLAGVKRGRRLRTVDQPAQPVRKPMVRTGTMSSQEGSISDTSDPTCESISFPRSPDDDALQQIRELAVQPTLPNPTPEPKHLLLCVGPLGSRIALPTEDSGFDIVPANIGCVFKPGVFVLPEENADGPSSILYGLAEWDATAEVKLVGGTFAFRGISSPLQHHALCKALRVSIYVHLSLLLEQHFLANSRVQLQFPVPKVRPSIVSSQSQPSPTTQLEVSPRSRQKHTFLPGILSFFSKKNTSLHRTSTASNVNSRGGSLDLTVQRVASRESSVPSSPRLSDDSSRLRRFSFISDPRPSFFKPSPSPEPEPNSPFSAVLARLTAASSLLSTSAGVHFAPPKLIADLAAKERVTPERRLKGDEKVGLTSILGWDTKERDREARGRAMCGVGGFARMQEISVLFSRHVPGSASSSPESSASSIELQKSERVFAACGRPSWRTYRYYARDGEAGEDCSLGDMVEQLSGRVEDACGRPGCAFKMGEHEMRLVHGGMRIMVAVTSDVADVNDDERDKEKDTDSKKEDDLGSGITMWLSCAVCKKRTGRMDANAGTCLFSFAKFLELLIYSPAICSLTPTLCEHTSPPLEIQVPHSTLTGPAPPLPASRLNIVRHFAAHGHAVSFSLSTIEDIFELRVPRLQIARKSGDKSVRTSMAKDDTKGTVDEEKKVLRREIKAWWEGIADHMDQLETSLVGSTLVGFRKSLPRLPSVDDAWEETDSEGDDDEEEEVAPTTPKLQKPQSINGLPPSAPTTPQITKSAQEFFPAQPPPLSRASTDPSPVPTGVPVSSDSMELLGSLRQTFHRTEQTLYSKLTHTPVASLNDVRRAFISASRGAEKRLLAWQKKHLPGRAKRNVQKLQAPEPEWWDKGCHTAPGCNIVMREDDWGSIIAFTMSTTDYSRELSSMSLVRPMSSATSPVAALTPTINNPTSSFFSAPRLFTSSTPTQPDPDKEDVVWHELEAYSAVISRKEHPRDATSLLSLREVLRQKSPIDSTSSLIGSSRFSSLGSAATRASSAAPPSAWSKPDVQISKHAAGGEVSGVPDSAGKILQEIDQISLEGSRPGSAMSSSSFLSGAMFADMHIKRGKASSILSVESDATIGKDDETDAGAEGAEPRSDVSHGKEATSVSEASSPVSSLTPTPSTFNTLTSGLSSAMRFMLSNGEIPRPSLFSKNHHGLLAPADAFAIDERPHIKYDWTIGKRLKFSCTVYYAKQFDNLRKRCGIDDVFVKSLSRSTNWAAEGGKSKSNFWKTSDDRFIIKTLVNAWNVADLQVLIDLAPSYFRYMDATASRATVLAKLIGFYTIEIRNLETGNVQSKADLLIMENIFYDQKIVKTFDLKGIQGRKVKTNAAGTQNVKTLFDGEWIEGQQRTLTLVRPHSKLVLREAIKSDADFLAKSNIMDYSLLLGVDQESKQIACGLVDTIGSYTFAKTLEYKAKQGLNSGKDVTVVPPAEYQERFVSALDGYFLACPDKWSRPTDDIKTLNDPSLLPSVL